MKIETPSCACTLLVSARLVRTTCSCRRRIRQRSIVEVLELVGEDVVADLEHRREPAVEEDAQTDAGVERELRLELEVAVVGVDDRDRARADRADAADDVGVVVEDEVAEAGELAVRRHVR